MGLGWPGPCGPADRFDYMLVKVVIEHLGRGGNAV